MADVSILILNWNGRKFLEVVLPSVFKIRSKYSYEVVIAENDSKDDSVSYIRNNFPQVIIVQNDKNYGMAGLNYAISSCSGKYILFMGNDMELEPDSMDELIRVIESDDKIVFVIPRLMDFYKRDVLDTGADWISRSFYSGVIRDKEFTDVAETNGGGTGLIRKDIIPKIGYFYDSLYFAGCEDIDLGMRIRLAGYKSAYAPKSVMYHMGAATLKVKHTNARATYLAERNYLIMFFKICSANNLLLLSPYVFLMRLLGIAKDIILFRISLALARIKAVFWIFSHPFVLLEKRKEIQKLRKAPDSYIFKNFTEKYIWKRA